MSAVDATRQFHDIFHVVQIEDEVQIVKPSTREGCGFCARMPDPPSIWRRIKQTQVRHHGYYDVS